MNQLICNLLLPTRQNITQLRDLSIIIRVQTFIPCVLFSTTDIFELHALILFLRPLSTSVNLTPGTNDGLDISIVMNIRKILQHFALQKKFYFNQICFIFCKHGNRSGISSPCSKRVFQPKEERPTEWTPIHNKHLIEKQTKKLNSFIAKKAPTNVKMAKRPSFLVLLLLKTWTNCRQAILSGRSGEMSAAPQNASLYWNDSELFITKLVSYNNNSDYIQVGHCKNSHWFY